MGDQVRKITLDDIKVNVLKQLRRLELATQYERQCSSTQARGEIVQFLQQVISLMTQKEQ